MTRRQGKYCGLLLMAWVFAALLPPVGHAAERHDSGQFARLDLGIPRAPDLTPSPPKPPVLSDPPPALSDRSPGPELQVPKGIRVVVFSPHPDDESLAAAGLMQRVIDNGGEVRVVFVTNGDGYPEAVMREYRRRNISVEDYIGYGRRRQAEALQALCELGIQPDDVVFLGFPDGGIDDLLSQHWSTLRPYTSPFTRLSRTRYMDTRSRWVSYAGKNLKDVLARLIETLSPDWVLLPDPRDDHADHCATGIFVLEALRTLNQEGDVSLGNMEFFTYLVHFRGYPQAPEWVEEVKKAGLFMSPFASAVLSSTQWYHLSVSREDNEAKERSLTAYASQHQMLGWFFKGFLSDRETFGRLDPGQVLAIPQEYALHFRHTNR